jgi:hypothetical protein
LYLVKMSFYDFTNYLFIVKIYFSEKLYPASRNDQT